MSSLKIYIRTDSSTEIGTGHVMRCLTFAEELKKIDAEVVFICREQLGNINDVIINKGYTVFPISGDFQWQNDAELSKAIIGEKIADLLIVDHYSLDYKWEDSLRNVSKKIMVIDDLANRKHNCDILLDQNYYSNLETRYEWLVPTSCKNFLGPRYALVRSEFKEARKKLKKRSEKISRILIFFGGSDPTNETEKAIEAVSMLNSSDLEIDVVVGKANPNKAIIEEKCNQLPSFNYFCQIEYMAELMAEADLAIGAGGSTTWERYYLDLPTIVIIVAENQKESTYALEEKELIINLGTAKQVTVDMIYLQLVSILANPAFLKKITNNTNKLMQDISLGINEIIESIFEESI